jgi:hypothetical protein
MHIHEEWVQMSIMRTQGEEVAAWMSFLLDTLRSRGWIMKGRIEVMY